MHRQGNGGQPQPDFGHQALRVGRSLVLAVLSVAFRRGVALGSSQKGLCLKSRLSLVLRARVRVSAACCFVGCYGGAGDARKR